MVKLKIKANVNRFNVSLINEFGYTICEKAVYGRYTELCFCICGRFSVSVYSPEYRQRFILFFPASKRRCNLYNMLARFTNNDTGALQTFRLIDATYQFPIQDATLNFNN